MGTCATDVWGRPTWLGRHGGWGCGDPGKGRVGEGSGHVWGSLALYAAQATCCWDPPWEVLGAGAPFLPWDSH